MHDHSAHAHANPGATGAGALRRERRLVAALAVTVAILVAEVGGGVAAGSLALLADAGHVLTDAAALALSLFAVRVARRPPTSRRTYGLHRVEILFALANAITLLVVAALVGWEAIGRLVAPHSVRAPLLLAVAALGLVANLATLAILGDVRGHGVGLRAAWVHVAADALGSVQALLAGAAIWAFGWTWPDAVASLLISVLIVRSATPLLRETVGILLEHAPSRLDVDALRGAMAGVPGVASVGDLHVWTIASGMDALSAHVGTDGSRPSSELLRELHALLRDRFAVAHVTLEIDEGVCHGGPHVV